MVNNSFSFLLIFIMCVFFVKTRRTSRIVFLPLKARMLFLPFYFFTFLLFYLFTEW